MTKLTDHIRQIDAGELDIGYADLGPMAGRPVLLLHGWPYDIHTYAEVAPMLAQSGHRVIVPHARGFGTTRFRSVAMPVYEYCDKDVRVRCAANSQGIALDPLLAPRIVRTGSFAHDESAASHIYVRSADGRRHRPGSELYRRIIDALTGGLVLRTTQQKCTIVGRFQAGVWLGHSSQSFWIDRDEVAGGSRMSDSASALRLNNGQ